MRLLFADESGKHLVNEDWIYLDEDSQTLHAFPEESHIGTHEYKLVVVDSGGEGAQGLISIDIRLGTSIDSIYFHLCSNYRILIEKLLSYICT